MKYETIVTQVMVCEAGKELFDATATEISLLDEAAGGMVSIKQSCDYSGAGEVRFDPDEWPTVRAAINDMVQRCEKYNKSLEA
ncbi:MAG: hypothetical protein FJ119_10835 [Deltaproteobacteria bacterium]|nr:hypothetical protein [Deltaproteobacteria bacterium]